MTLLESERLNYEGWPSTILIVDDDPDITQSLEIFLEEKGCMSILAAPSAELALRKLQQQRPDLVLLDLNLPDGSGLEFLKAVKTSHPETEVIVMTGGGNEELGCKMLSLKPFEFLKKPFDLNHLERVLSWELATRSLDRPSTTSQSPNSVQGNQDGTFPLDSRA